MVCSGAIEKYIKTKKEPPVFKLWNRRCISRYNDVEMTPACAFMIIIDCCWNLVPKGQLQTLVRQILDDIMDH